MHLQRLIFLIIVADVQCNSGCVIKCVITLALTYDALAAKQYGFRYNRKQRVNKKISNKSLE